LINFFKIFNLRYFSVLVVFYDPLKNFLRKYSRGHFLFSKKIVFWVKIGYNINKRFESANDMRIYEITSPQPLPTGRQALLIKEREYKKYNRDPENLFRMTIYKTKTKLYVVR